ncbi:MAG: SH3 domain-containing protein [Leptospirales bacterium]|nr:SH3 domain-containing protein [Leptospirales bacterium]
MKYLTLIVCFFIPAFLYPEALDVSARINSDKVILRNGPSRTAAAIDTLALGEVVKILEKANSYEVIYKCQYDWYQVAIGSKRGWVYGQFLSNVVDSQWKRIRAPSNYALRVPRSWRLEGTIVYDVLDRKVMEFFSSNSYQGNLLQFYLDSLKTEPVLITPRTVVDTRQFTLGKIPGYRVHTRIAAEGGCPAWVVVWDPVVYLLPTHSDTFHSFAVYLRNDSDAPDLKLADSIASSLEK